MPQIQLIPPDRYLLDRTQYRIKPSFWPVLSSNTVATILCLAGIELIHPILSVVTVETLPQAIAFLLGGVIFIILVTYLTVKYWDFTISLTTIRGFDLIGVWRKELNLQDIKTAKLNTFFAKCLRSISIKSTKNERAIVLYCFYYDAQKILDRVRECAGANHPLTLALERVVVLPPAKPFKVLWQAIVTIAIVILIWLIGGNLVASSQEQTLNKDITAFVRQHPTIPPNQSAIDLQTSIAKLGLSVVNFGDGSKVKVSPTPAASDEWKSIDLILDKYVTERLKKDLSEPIPAKLATYLTTHRADIETIESQLSDRALPDWGSDTRWIDRGDLQAGDSITAPAIKSLDLLQIQRLLFADLWDKQQSSNLNIAKNLKAIENLDRSFQSQTLITGQVFDLISNRNTNKFIRLFDSLPTGWEQIVDSPSRAKMMRTALDRESMIFAKMMQDPKLFEMSMRDSSPLFWFTKYHHLARPYNRLLAVNYYQTMQQRLAYWDKQNVCHTDGKDGVEDGIISSGTDILARQYPKAIIGNLDRELTIGIRRIKSQLKLGIPIEKVANEFDLASQTCPGEKWTARVEDNVILISFSHPPNWGALLMNAKDHLDRLTYKIQG
jgi:hypothetical protein